MSSDALLVAIVVLALVFDFTNGFHDTANAVATSVSTRAIRPRAAVVVAATMNLAGAFASTAVATTIGTGILVADVARDADVLIAALVGAIVWNLVTWYYALPSSSSYALIGGLVGASIAHRGTDAIQWGGLAERVLVPAIVAPLLGFAAALLVAAIVLRAVRRRSPAGVDRGFRLAQLGAGALMAFAHGTNDAQKTMAVIGLALVSTGHRSTFGIPTWVLVASAVALALGTLAGGWRIMRTLGAHVFRLEPPDGFAAQAAATGVLVATAAVGAPVSTTNVITGAVFGAGSARRAHVHWGLGFDILFAWVLTLPAAALIAAAVILPTRLG